VHTVDHCDFLGGAPSGDWAFAEYTSLGEILIPHVVKAITDRVFYLCTQLTTAVLGEGLEKIGPEAFAECTSLHEIFDVVKN
jgi:hypothetical protein